MLLAVIAVGIALQSSQAVDTYGKTEAQILEMGSEAWYKFYTGRAGDSTAAMTSGYGIYADIASDRNDKLLSDPKLPHRNQIKRLSKLLLTFGGDMISVGSAITGGGTLWNTMSAAEYAGAEDAIYSIIRGHSGKPPKHVVVSQVTHWLDEAPAQLKGAEKDQILTGEPLKVANQSLAEARSTYREIVDIASGFDRAGSDKILGFCLDQAKLINGFG